MKHFSKSRLLKYCMGVYYILGILMGISLIMWGGVIINKVRSGHGLDTFVTYRGFKTNYTAAFGFMLVMSPIIVFLGILEVKRRRREKQEHHHAVLDSCKPKHIKKHPKGHMTD